MKDHHQSLNLSEADRESIATSMATCPFVSTALASGQLEVFNSSEQPLASIEAIAHLGDSGGGDLGTRVLKLFARGNHSRFVTSSSQATSMVPNGMFSLQFGGSQGAHAGHSGILLSNPKEANQGRLNMEEFNRLGEFTDQQGRLSVDAIGDFIADNLRRDEHAQVFPGWEIIKDVINLLDEFKDTLLDKDANEKTEVNEALTKLLGEDHLMASAGEWALLFAFLQNSPKSDDGDIALSDVKLMFVDKQFPQGWETWKKSSLSWVKLTLRITKDAALAYYAGWK